jgi:hypothetical protein
MAGGNLDLTIPLSTFLSTAVSDGTWNDIVGTLKSDEPGEEAAASQIYRYGGQLWSNIEDDMFLACYAYMQGYQVQTIATSDATPTAGPTVDTLLADRDAFYTRVTVTARHTSTAGFVLQAELGGLFYRTGGVVLVAAPVKTITRVGFTTADADMTISGNVVSVTVTGEAATDITWDVSVTESRRLS